MRRRAGQWAIKQARRDRRAWLWVNKVVVAKATALWIIVSVMAIGYMSVFAPIQATWFTAGVMATTYFWLISKALDAADGTALRRLGGDAERWVSDDLGRLRKQGWVLIDRVPFADGDVDHVLIGPGGAWAVETKRSSTPVTIEECSISGVYSGDPCYQARRGARHIAGLLRPIGISVRPAVVLAGPGAPETKPGGALVIGGDYADVLVLGLRGLSEQLDAFTFASYSGDQIEQARVLVERFVHRRDLHERSRARR